MLKKITNNLFPRLLPSLFPNLFILAFTAALLFANIVQAQTPQEIIQNQDWITRQQHNEIEENRRIREEGAIKSERERQKKEADKEVEQETPITGKPDQCFSIKEITLIDANSLSRKEQRNLTLPFIGKCVEATLLSDLISKINSYYNSAGYVTAQVSVPQQNIQSGFLKLKILEGKINKIILGEDKFTDKMQKFTAFGGIEGDVLNINEINQGIYQINRLASNKAAIKIEPGIDEGEANIVVSNKNKFPATATVGYDNLGNEFTGIRRSNFSGSFDNLLSLNDNINFSYSTNLDDDSGLKDIKSFSSGISIPLKYYTLSYDYSRSAYRGTNNGENSVAKLTGYSDRNNVTLDRVLLNDGNLRISASGSITAKKSASYLNDSKLENSERRLTIGNVGLTLSNYFKNGVNIYLKPSYSRGLKILNAKQDLKNLSSATAKAQFDVFKLYASVSKRLIIPIKTKIKIPIDVATQMEAQFSKQTLFGTEQFSVGGYYSVRGFRETYITGDSGYYLRNRANISLASLMLPFLYRETKENGSPTVSRKKLEYLNKIAFEPFYDYGHVRNKYDGSAGRLSGAGIKTIFKSKYFNSSLTYSWAINKSSLITAVQKENKLLFFEISSTF